MLQAVEEQLSLLSILSLPEGVHKGTRTVRLFGPSLRPCLSTIWCHDVMYVTRLCMQWTLASVPGAGWWYPFPRFCKPPPLSAYCHIPLRRSQTVCLFVIISVWPPATLLPLALLPSCQYFTCWLIIWGNLLLCTKLLAKKNLRQKWRRCLISSAESRVNRV